MNEQYVGTKIVTAWAQEKDGQAGYSVKYSDGYTSWCPKQQFEEANIVIGHIDHLPLHQQRVMAEKAQIDDRLGKLNVFCAGSFFKALPKDEQERLDRQREAMTAYTMILLERVQQFWGNQA